MRCRYKYLWPAVLVFGALLMAVPWAVAGPLDDAAAKVRACGVADEVVYLVETGVERGELDEDGATRLLESLSFACEGNLPLAPLEDKLTEGLAKRVMPVRIGQALDRIAGNYAMARDMLLQRELEPQPQVVTVIGDGLQAGVPPELFETVLQGQPSGPERSMKISVEVASLLFQAGLPQGPVIRVVTAGAGGEGLTPQWRYLVQVLLVARARGVSDADFMEAALAEIAEGGRPSGVATRLGFTMRRMGGQPPVN